MNGRGRHCPFLNRDDSRCAANFSVDRLGHMYAHCFDHYHACGTYLELLVERRVRGVETEHVQPLVSLTVRPRVVAPVA